jgi:hypothetical protein
VFFVGLDGGVGVPNEGRRDEDGAPWQEVYDQFEIPQNEMAAAVGVKVTECSDGAPPPGEIREVEVGEGDGPRAKVEGSGSEDGDFVGEVAEECGVLFV